MKKSNFFEEVYQKVRSIPEGRVTTYGLIAQSLATRDARRVGHALHANRNRNTPCHRVVNKNGRLAAKFSFGGIMEQRKRLEKEKVDFIDKKHVDLKKHLWFPEK